MGVAREYWKKYWKDHWEEHNAMPIRKIGDEFQGKNGYWYVKTETGWRPKQHLIMEEKLGRPLLDGERVYFHDKNPSNFNPDNLHLKSSHAPSSTDRKSKVCPRCNRQFAVIEFYRASNGRLSAYCKSCTKQYAKERRDRQLPKPFRASRSKR